MKYTSSINVNISMPEKVLEVIDKQRGDIPRSAFIRRIVLNALGSAGGGAKK